MHRALHVLSFRSPVVISGSYSFISVPGDSPSRGGDVAIYVLDINQPSLPTPCLYGPFSCISFHRLMLPTTVRFLTLFFLSYFCLFGSFN